MVMVCSKTKKVTNTKAILRKIKCLVMVKKLGPNMVALLKASSIRIRNRDLANKPGRMAAIIKDSFKMEYFTDKASTTLLNNKRLTLDHL